MTVSELRRLISSMPMNAVVVFGDPRAKPIAKVEHMPSRTKEAGFVVLS